MKIDDFTEVKISKKITADDHKSLIQVFCGRFYGSRGAKILERGHVCYMYSEFTAITEIFFDCFGLMIKQENQLGNAMLL